jgi:hypothetical protein
MLQVGDTVYVEDSAQIDTCFLSWAFIKANPKAIVKAKMSFSSVGENSRAEAERLYAVEWDQDFEGGHTCQGTCKNKRGQFVTMKHLSLCFDESREVQTVPQIGEFLSDTAKYKMFEDKK